MVVLQEGMDPVARQRVEWGQNIAEALEQRKWTRKQLLKEIFDAYGFEVAQQSLTQWLQGETAPRPDIQAALAGVFGIPHHMLFPPVKLDRKGAA